MERFAYLKDETGIPVKTAGLDSGYDTIAIHYGLTRLGITAYIRPCQRGKKKGGDGFTVKDFQWMPEEDCYLCPNGRRLTYRGTWMAGGVPLRNYGALMKDCGQCPDKARCSSKKSQGKLIARKPCQEFMEAGRERIGTPSYQRALSRRNIVCEGNFGLQKRCHNLRFTRKRGIENVLEQCLLSATALNLKRLVKGLSLLQIPGEMSAVSALHPGFLRFPAFISCLSASFGAQQPELRHFVNRPTLSRGWLKKGVSARRRNVQASQKCAFLRCLQAGAKALDPNAAYGRKVSPKSENNGRKRVESTFVAGTASNVFVTVPVSENVPAFRY